MRASLFLMSAAILATLVRSAPAQLTPAPVISTVVDFDDQPLGADNAFSVVGPVRDEYVSRGLVFSGFGQNGGGLVSYDNPGKTTPPNWMLFASIATMQNGGLMQSPETLSFYPPATSLQFDSSTISADCEGTMSLIIHAFAADNSPLGTTTQVLLPDAMTISLTFPPPGAARVVITSTHTCGTGLFTGVEIFSIDTIAFVTAPTPASKCAQEAIDAAGKKAKAETACYAKALQNGVAVDPACVQKAVDTFNKGFAKAQAAGDCPTDTDGPTVEGAVDGLVSSAIALVTGGSPGPDICFGKKLVSIGKKAQSLTKCYSKATKSGTAADEACGEKAAGSFNSSLKKCGTPTQLAPVESLLDQFGSLLARSLTVPTTTTTTTTTSTTTTTMPPPLGPHLSFTTTPGTANCTIPPDPPFSGELDSDTGGTTKIADLGLGCLYIGAGAGAIPPSNIPENATSILDSADGTTLTASFGTGQRDCTRGPEATKHCINDATIVCTSDADCADAPGGCAFDANCFFGPPVPVNGFPSSCVINTFAADANGTVDQTTGESTVNIVLASRVYLTLGQPTACPTCSGGACNWGANAGGACTSTNAAGTTLDCQPGASTFIATLPINLSPLTTGSVIETAADGLFCPGQFHPGAFGQAAAQAIQQTGSPSGDLHDGLPHASTLVSDFCIPATNNPALDGLADLPGPGSLSLGGEAQFGSPSGAFLTD